MKARHLKEKEDACAAREARDMRREEDAQRSRRFVKVAQENIFFMRAHSFLRTTVHDGVAKGGFTVTSQLLSRLSQINTRVRRTHMVQTSQELKRRDDL